MRALAPLVITLPPVPPELVAGTVPEYLRRLVDALQPLERLRDARELLEDSVATAAIADGAVTADKVGADWPKALLTNNAAQAIPDITDTAVSFNTELVDVGAMHAGGAPTRITIVRDGLYAISAFVDWQFNVTGGRRLRIRKNGVSDILENEMAGLFLEHAHTIAGHAPLVAGDYLELVVFQNSGGPLNVNANETGVKFAAVWCP